MAAPSIPNLNTLRANRPPRHGPNRRRGGASSRDNPFDSNAPEERDKIILHTDNDASGSRLSAVRRGYLTDPFAEFLHSGKSSSARSYFPIINRGTYVRSMGIDLLVKRFLATNPGSTKQILSLGAGTDTRYFRLVAENPSLPLIYHEIDLPENTTIKIKLIMSAKELLSVIHKHCGPDEEFVLSQSDSNLTSRKYNIHALDLRTITPSNPPSLPNLSSTLPTLILSECCLIYLPPDKTAELLQVFTRQVIPAPTPISLIVYEPIKPHDPFGRTMISNLASRGIYLATLEKYHDLDAQRARLQDAGFSSGQRAADIAFVFEKWIDAEEKARVGRCEMLDEVEEWVLLARHYCLTWGWRNGDEGQDRNVFEEAFAAVDSQDR